jgi:hypothetical protein
MRVLVGILSGVGLAFSGLFLMAGFAAAGMSDAPPEGGLAWLPLLLPLLYYGYCLVSSIRPPQGDILLTSGLIAHVVALVFCFFAVEKGAPILMLGPLIMAPCWFFMYAEIIKNRKAN